MVAYRNDWISQPGDVLIILNCMLFGAYFLALLGPHLMTVVKARVAAGVVYRIIDEVDVRTNRRL